MNHMASLDSRDVTHQLPHTHSLSQMHAYTCIQTARRCCEAFRSWHFGGRDSVCKIGGGGGSSAGVGGLMFDWVSFVLLHTHGYTLIPIP